MKNPEKLKVYRALSILLTSIAIVLLTFMVLVESEPGLLPLFLLVIGITFSIYFHVRLKQRANRNS